MVEIKNNYWFAGILIAVALIGYSTGQVFELNPTGNYRTCTSGWQMEQSGAYEGKFSCSARAGVYYDCVGTRDSKNTPKYYCDEATRTEVKTEQIILTPPAKECPKAHTLVYTDFGKYFCEDINACDTPVDIANKCQSPSQLTQS